MSAFIILDYISKSFFYIILGCTFSCLVLDYDKVYRNAYNNCNAILSQFNILQKNCTILYNKTMQCTTSYYTTLHHTTLYYTTLKQTILCYTTLYTPQYMTLQHVHTMLHYATLTTQLCCQHVTVFNSLQYKSSAFAL